MAVNRTRFLLILTMSCVAARQGANAQCAGYAVDIFKGPQCQILDPWAGDARAINDAGDVSMGYVDCGENGHVLIWSLDGTTIELPLSSNQGFPIPNSLNAKGEAAGSMDVPGFSLPHAFLFSNGMTTDLGMLPSDISSEAFGIANNGRVVGYSAGCNPTCRYHAVLWEKGGIRVLDLPMGPNRIAYDISESGEYVCGWMGIGPSPHFGSHAFRWNDGVVDDLGVLPGTTSSEARGVNNFGQVCGVAYTPVDKFDMIRHGFVWSGGKMEEVIGLEGYEQTMALSINDASQILGMSFHTKSGVGEPFIWQNGVSVSLNDLISPELDLHFHYAWSINNAGQISGQAGLKNPKSPQTVAVRLTPIPETPGDFNCNKIVDVDDLLGVLNSWGIEGTTTADFNQDKIVDVEDLVIVIDNWTM